MPASMFLQVCWLQGLLKEGRCFRGFKPLSGRSAAKKTAHETAVGARFCLLARRPLAVILRLREAHFLVFSGLYGVAGNFFFVFRGLYGVAGNSCFRLHGFWPGVIVSQEVAQRMGGEAIHELGMHLDQMFLGLETLFLLNLKKFKLINEIDRHGRIVK